MKYSIAVFKQEEKKSEKSPDYAITLQKKSGGEFVDITKTYEVDGEKKETKTVGGLWIKEAKSGIKYLSGSFELEDGQEVEVETEESNGIEDF